MGVEAIGGGLGVSAGPAMGVGIGSTIVNEGPVAPAFLENTMPLSFNKPLGEIIFNPLIIQQAEQVAAAAWETPQPVSVVEQAEMVAAKAWEVPSLPRSVVTTPVAPDIIQIQRTQTALEAAGMVDLSQQVVNYLKPEVRTVYQQASVVAIPSPQEKLVEQIVEEEDVDVEDREEKRVVASEEEEVESIRLKNVVDVPVSEQREYEIEQATDKAEAEAKAEGVEGIEGWRIVKFLPHQHPGNESGIIRNSGLRDGSLDETEQELAARKFVSKAEVKQSAAAIVSKEKPPVKLDKDGQLVKDQDVARVFKHNIFKSQKQLDFQKN